MTPRNPHREAPLCTAIALVFVLVGAALIRADPDDAPPDLVEVIKQNGYPAESHSLQTDDGYLLTLHRITGSPSKSVSPVIPRDNINWNEHLQKDLPGMPVVVVHGLGSSAAQWVYFGPNNSLGYSLADKGYDVWLANVRGSPYSDRHISLDKNSYEFWNFSWEQQALHDLTTTVEYVVNRTGYEQVWYVGYSMGTTMFFVMNSMRPEMNARIKHGFLFAPTAYMAHSTLELKPIMGQAKLLHDSLQMMNVGKLGIKSMAMTKEREAICAASEEICKMAAGANGPKMYNEEQYFEGREDLIKDYFPNDVSTKQVWHYAQVIDKGTFGPLITDPIFGKYTDYDLTKITVPMTFIYSDSDKCDVPEDVEELARMFPDNPPKMHKIPLKSWDHLDFMWGRDKHKYMIEPVLAYLEEVLNAKGPIRRATPPQNNPIRSNLADMQTRKRSAKSLFE